MQRRLFSSFALPWIAITAISCAGTNDPQLSMCQALVKELTAAGVSSWGDIKKNETERMLTVSIKYVSDTNVAGNIACQYPRHEGGTTDTAPSSVKLNGTAVDQKTLIVSGGRVSNAMLTEAAELTSLKAENLARDAAGKVIDSAKDAAKSLQQ